MNFIKHELYLHFLKLGKIHAESEVRAEDPNCGMSHYQLDI